MPIYTTHYLQKHGFKPWAPRTLNLGLKPWVYYKKRVFTHPDTPKTILSYDSTYKLYKPVELPTLRTVRVCIPTHFRVEKTVAVLQKYFYWPNLRQDVRKYIRSCNACAIANDLKTISLLLYDVNMNCIKSMNEAHKSIRREPNNIDNTHTKTTS